MTSFFYLFALLYLSLWLDYSMEKIIDIVSIVFYRGEEF